VQKEKQTRDNLICNIPIKIMNNPLSSVGLTAIIQEAHEKSA
jgi:hypothetical protein